MAEVAKVDVVGVGLNATDTVIPVKQFPTPGSKVEFRAMSVLPGGQVATAMVACQRWGMKARYVGKLGEDEAAAIHHREFARAGVETRIVTVPGGTSAQSIILVDSEGDRTVLNRRDERLQLAPAELSREWITQASVLLIDGYDTAAATLAAGWAREEGIPVVADLDELYPGIDALLPKIDYLIVNHDFPCRLMKTDDLGAALKGMQSRYGSLLAAATLGEHGVLAWDGNRLHFASAYRVPVADTTGAGDIFRAGFIYGLHRGWPLERQLDFACAAAARNCMAVGARGSIEAPDVIENLMATGTQYRSPLAASVPKV